MGQSVKKIVLVLVVPCLLFTGTLANAGRIKPPSRELVEKKFEVETSNRELNNTAQTQMIQIRNMMEQLKEIDCDKNSSDSGCRKLKSQLNQEYADLLDNVEDHLQNLKKKVVDYRDHAGDYLFQNRNISGKDLKKHLMGNGRGRIKNRYYSRRRNRLSGRARAITANLKALAESLGGKNKREPHLAKYAAEYLEYGMILEDIDIAMDVIKESEGYALFNKSLDGVALDPVSYKTLSEVTALLIPEGVDYPDFITETQEGDAENGVFDPFSNAIE